MEKLICDPAFNALPMPDFLLQVQAGSSPGRPGARRLRFVLIILLLLPVTAWRIPVLLVLWLDSHGFPVGTEIPYELCMIRVHIMKG